MKYKLIPFAFLFILIPLVAAQEQQTTGPFKWNQCVTLGQICANCTYVNITQINSPVNNTFLLASQVAMTKADTVYNYTFCKTGILGRYIVNWKANPTGSNDVGAFDFNVTTTGFDIPIGFQFLFIGIVYFLIWLGVYKRDVTITILGTVGLYFIGLWILQYGFNIYKTGLTEAFAWVNLGVAFYLSAIMAYEYIT